MTSSQGKTILFRSFQQNLSLSWPFKCFLCCQAPLKGTQPHLEWYSQNYRAMRTPSGHRQEHLTQPLIVCLLETDLLSLVRNFKPSLGPQTKRTKTQLIIPGVGESESIPGTKFSSGSSISGAIGRYSTAPLSSSSSSELQNAAMGASFVTSTWKIRSNPHLKRN